MLYLALAFSFLWFIFIAPNEWSRHVWQGILLGMLMVSVTFGLLIQNTFTLRVKLVYIALCVIATASMVNYQVLEPKFFLDQHSIDKWRAVQYIHGSDGFPHVAIFSMADQQALISYFNAHIHQDDRVYYEGGFLVAEVSPLVDKVFYPLNRYFNNEEFNPDNGSSYLIFGPYQQGPWSIVAPDYMHIKMASLCDQVVFRNSSYILCTLKE
ncbi:hypothetical protein KDK_56930 [Dictyobacter kobayashii]|uniref:Uncharacterized protein n=2 Tax=Dictyobacter kobayashii TaxID=2014872 RepID=A0A402AS67_9CHLR|nr:hypothetical protein KDK_56930 [Dictyobacter kobayashii]